MHLHTGPEGLHRGTLLEVLQKTKLCDQPYNNVVLRGKEGGFPFPWDKVGILKGGNHRCLESPGKLLTEIFWPPRKKNESDHLMRTGFLALFCLPMLTRTKEV